MNPTKATLASLLCLCCASVANATLIIDVGDHVLLPGTANQQIDILVSSDPSDSDISGSNIRAEIGDGAGILPEPVFQGPVVALGPQNGATITGTVFDVTGGFLSGNAPGGVGFEQFVNAGTTTPFDVDANGILISFLIDTTATGSPGDVFPLRLGSFVTPGLPGDTELLGPIGNANPLSGVVINNGKIIIAVPESSAAFLMLVAGGATALMRRRF